MEKTKQNHKVKPPVPRINNINRVKYLNYLEASLKTLDINWPSKESNEGVEAVVEMITNTITTSAIKSKLLYKLFSKNKLDFWCEELLKLKDKNRTRTM